MYLVAVGVVSVWAVLDDIREHKSLAGIIADIAATTTLGFLFVAYFVPAFGQSIGWLTVPLFVTGFLWIGVSAQRDILATGQDPDLSPRANLIAEHAGVILGVLMFAPLIGFASLAAARAL